MLEKALSLAVAFENNERLDFGIDLIHETVELYLKHKQFEELNEDLRELNPNYSTNILLSVLVATLSAKSKLPNRQIFVNALKDLCEDEPEIYKGLD